MDTFALKLLSTDDLVDELRTRYDGFALVCEAQTSEQKSISAYFYHGGHFRALGLAVALVDFLRDSRYPMKTEDYRDLDDA